MEKLEFFKDLGFSEYEGKAILSLIRLKSASPKEISFDSSVPQNKLYGILKKFEKEGLLANLPGEIKKYQIINLDSFVKKKINEKKIKLSEMRKISKIFNEKSFFEEKFVFSLIRGQRAIMNKLAENNLKVRKEIIGVQRDWKIWGEGLRAMQKTIKNGVDVKLIGNVNERNRQRALEWKKLGCKIRKYNKKFGDYPLRFSIFDGKEARITIGKPEIQNPEDYITIWTTSKPIVAILRKQFLEMWKQSEKF
jgi:sugar-specific transcriptional regulator TrmB